MTVIVDTCVWARFLRRDRDRHDPLGAEVTRLVRDDAVQMLGCIRQEILSGAQPQSRFEQLKEYLRFFPNLPLDSEDDENAAAYYNTCRSKGVQGTATDLLICAVAVRHGMRILTTDRDFDEFASSDAQMASALWKSREMVLASPPRFWARLARIWLVWKFLSPANRGNVKLGLPARPCRSNRCGRTYRTAGRGDHSCGTRPTGACFAGRCRLRLATNLASDILTG